jgi:hypothetical protein
VLKSIGLETGSHLQLSLALRSSFYLFFLFFFFFFFHFTPVVMIKEDNFGHLMDLHRELGGAFLYFGHNQW